MPTVRIKDRKGLICECRLWANHRENYWQIFLWDDVDSFRNNTKELTPFCYGCHLPCSTIMDLESGELIPTSKVGEIHFIKNYWNLEAIAHELSHALLHRIRLLCPSYKSIIEDNDMEKEEVICYEFGKWVTEIYTWLWSNNPLSNKKPND